MQVEAVMIKKCGSKCRYWHFSLRFPIGQGPRCKKYMLSLDDAREICDLHGKVKKKKKPRAKASAKLPKAKRTETNKTIMVAAVKRRRAECWPVVPRGWGSLTRNDEGARL